MMRVLLLLALLTVEACKRADVVRADPTPPVDASVPLKPVIPTLMALHGRIVDVTTGEVKFPLRSKLPLDEVNDARNAYVLDDDGMLRAWELSTGKPLWSLSTAARALVPDEANLYLLDTSDLRLVNKTTGVAKTFISRTLPAEEVRPFGGGFAVRRGLTVEVYAGLSTAAYPKSTLERFMEDYRVALVAAGSNVCFVDLKPPEFELHCIDTSAKETVHAVVAAPAGVGRVSPILATQHHAVIGTYSFGSKSARAAVVIRLRDGKEVARLGDEIVALVESPAGDLEGLIAVGEEVRFYEPTGALRWKYKPKWAESFAKVLARDNTLVFAMHNIIATGVEVFALRKSDGRELWIGETKLPPIGHSKYHNRVTLESRGDAAILRGHESSVEHVHVYDLRTGALRYHDP